MKIKNIDFSQGMPKICVPLVGKDKEELKQELMALEKVPFDLIEWRLDCFDAIEDATKRKEALNLIRSYQPESVLLATFRTVNEGGNHPTSQYETLYEDLINTTQLDLVDVELFLDQGCISKVMKQAKDQGVKVVLSNHDFKATPSLEELLDRFKKMNELGGDFLKIAVMPQTKEDVLTLLEATTKAKALYSKPIISMSMSPLGLMSRICGETFGSCVTFGSVLKPSAPGQIQASKLKEVLQIIHEGL